MDEMLNVKALLLLEPMFYVVLEGTFLLISIFVFSKEYLHQKFQPW